MQKIKSDRFYVILLTALLLQFLDVFIPIQMFIPKSHGNSEISWEKHAFCSYP